MSTAPELKWPERLTLRDTEVYADEGQRIFTTATGYGYAKCEYVRADLAALPREVVAWRWRYKIDSRWKVTDQKPGYFEFGDHPELFITEPLYRGDVL